MGFVAQAGHLGFKTQAAKGTYLSPGAVAPNQGVFIFFRSGALGGNRELLVPDPEIGGARDIPDAQLGPISYSGEIDMYLRMESLATFLRGALGAVSSSGATGTGYTHAITPADTIPWLSVEEKIANGYETFKYTDAKVNTFHMEADANGYLTGTVGLVALKQELTTATPTGTQRRDSSPLLVGSNICVRWGGVDLPAKSFSLDINNNLEDDDYRLCSMTLGDAVEKRREITMGVTIRPNDAALWKTATWGSPTATAPLGQSFKDDVEIEIVTYEDIPGATGVKYNCTITIPYATIAPFSLDPSGDDVLEHDIEIRALRPVLATPILSADVLNSFATVA
jgi:tail tube protein